MRMPYPRPRTFVGFLIYATIIVGSTTAVGLSMIWHGIDPARAYFAGTNGQVTVAECRWVEGNPDGWDCRGAFKGDTMAIDEVRIRDLLDVEPVDPVDTVVSGPHATTAWTPGVGCSSRSPQAFSPPGSLRSSACTTGGLNAAREAEKR